MGCVPNRPKLYNNGMVKRNGRINIEKKIEEVLINKSKINKVSNNSWMKIIDFLSYSDLKEVGKTTKYFNSMCKQYQILTKFFKKKEFFHSKPNQKNIKKISSFSNINISFCSTSDEKE